MVSVLSGTTVFFTSIFTINYFSNFISTINLSSDYEGDKSIASKVKSYKSIMTIMFLLGSVSFLGLTIFGYLNNCKFLPREARVTGVQSYITFLILFVLINFYGSTSGKNKIKLEKLNVKKEVAWMCILLFMCIALTLVAVLVI